jgi:hypothetical protein
MLANFSYAESEEFSPKFSLILSSHLQAGLLSVLLTSGIPITIFYAAVMSPHARLIIHPPFLLAYHTIFLKSLSTFSSLNILLDT